VRFIGLVDPWGVTEPSRSAGGRTVSLGAGLRVPYPEPKDDAATRVGKGNRRTDTKPEVRIRSELHRRGLRFRKDFPIQVEGRKVRPDIVFTRARVAVFVDGCFWHGCPEHQHIPNTNREYWVPKLRRNMERDRQVDEGLRQRGWGIVRAWEHEGVADVSDRIAGLIRQRSAHTVEGP
jgi:DNA mismatch endonuclease (patch repair protein)